MVGAPRVVVAVDSDDDGQAVDWAAAEAAARRCVLEVVRVVPLRWAVDPSGLVPVADVHALRGIADDLLRRAVERGRAVASDTEVVAHLLAGPAVPSLLAHGDGAQLLVLARPSGPRGLFASSVSADVAAHARCPVAVIGPLARRRSDGAPPRVVVGVDGHGWCTAALGFAFRAAAQRGLPLTAVHVWTPDTPADLEGICAPAAVAEANARAALRRTLEPFRREFGDVPVRIRLSRADPANALVRESEGAALVVVGTRGRGVVRARLFGSVSRGVTRWARCPVVVVRRPRTERVQPVRSTGRSGTTRAARLER